MDPNFWAKIHGASTHLPIALAFCSWAMDVTACVPLPFLRSRAPQFHATGYWMMMLAALGTIPAVGSGLLLTKGEIMGHDLLRFHHLFVWPAYGLLVGLGTWRAIVGVTPSRRAFAGYLAVGLLSACLLAGAGYWGGEMLLNT
jgi:uncharacterized membrane protein